MDFENSQFENSQFEHSVFENSAFETSEFENSGLKSEKIGNWTRKLKIWIVSILNIKNWNYFTPKLSSFSV